MDYNEAVAYLDRHIRLGGRPGLDRIVELLETMGRPDEGYPIIHVAGTNGKTSTTRIASLILVAHGLTTGTYISPHLESVEERLGVNGRNATRDEFALAISDVAAFADMREARGAVPNTYFELVTAAAFAFFADQAVNGAVVEVGLGGRLDATNVVDAEVAVVTSIGIDHTEYLGESLASIAAEKAAIAGPNSIMVSGPLPDPALEVVAGRAREMGIQHRRFGHDFDVESAERGVRGWLVSVRGAEATYEDMVLPLHGRYQLANLSVAIAAAEALLGDRLDDGALRDATAAATVPGRMEAVSHNPIVMLDGAHNADGVASLADSLAEEFPTTRWQIVIGVLGDKNVELMVERLSPLADGWVTTAAHSDRAVGAEDLAARIRPFTSAPVLVARTVEDALDMARAEAGVEGAVLVAGSLYLVGEARAQLHS